MMSGAYCLKRQWKEIQAEFLQGVLSRASFRRQPPNGNKKIKVLSLHISKFYAKKRGIGKKLILTIRAVMLDKEVDLVASDQRGCMAIAETTSVSLKKPLLTSLCRCLPAPHHCGDFEKFQVSGRTFADAQTS